MLHYTHITTALLPYSMSKHHFTTHISQKNCNIYLLCCCHICANNKYSPKMPYVLINLCASMGIMPRNMLLTGIYMNWQHPCHQDHCTQMMPDNHNASGLWCRVMTMQPNWIGWVVHCPNHPKTGKDKHRHVYIPLKLAVYFIWTEYVAHRRIILSHTSWSNLKNFKEIFYVLLAFFFSKSGH